jgi:hypothetical protein
LAGIYGLATEWALLTVMPGLVPGLRDLIKTAFEAWMAGQPGEAARAAKRNGSEGTAAEIP